MTPVTTFAGKTIALFGLGGSGLATAKALVAGGADCVCWDDNGAQVAAARTMGLTAQDLRHMDFTTVDALILSPGVPLTHPQPHWSVALAKSANVPVIGDVELFCRERAKHAPNSPLIAITGTNGKSTTTALIAHILSQAGYEVALGGNIGTAILNLPAPALDHVHVIECSSYQIDLAPSLNPSIGVHLNISPDHLDRHGTLDHYASVKARLLSGSDHAVVGIDDRFSADMADDVARAAKPLTRIGIHNPVTAGLMLDGNHLVEIRDGASRPLINLATCPALRGDHNAQNAAAAFAACQFAGATDNAIIAGLKSFPGLAHRMEIIAEHGRVRFVNDSKATNADAAERALSSFDHIYWIAGGRPKAGGIEGLDEHYPRIAKAYLIGEAQDQFAATLKGRLPYQQHDNLTDAVKAAARDAAADPAPDSTVLLSPACASWDQFKSFEVRGDTFKAAVADLLKEGARS